MSRIHIVMSRDGAEWTRIAKQASGKVKGAYGRPGTWAFAARGAAATAHHLSLPVGPVVRTLTTEANPEAAAAVGGAP